MTQHPDGTKWCVVCHWQSGFIFPQPCASFDEAVVFASKIAHKVGEPQGLAKAPRVTTLEKAGPAVVPPSMRAGRQ